MTGPQITGSGSQNRPEIKPLTSLRGLAAMAVVLTHFSATAEQHSAGWIPSIVPHGYMAVDFFFVLSGFIMSYTYLSAFENGGMRAYGPFLWKRVARIVPLGLAVLALILACGAVAGHWGHADLFINRNASDAGLPLAILTNALHLQAFFNTLSLNDPSWSVSVELVAYLFFPIFVLIVFRGTPALLCMAVAAAVAGLVCTTTSEPRFPMVARGPWLDLIRCFAGFAIGMMTFRVFRSGALHRIGLDPWTYLVSAVCIGAVLARIDLLTALIFPAVILAWSLNKGSASRIMSSRVPYFLGTVSFSIYLVHHLLRHPELALLQWMSPEKVSPAVALIFAVVGSLSALPLAALAYRWVERPGRSALNAMVGHMRRSFTARPHDTARGAHGSGAPTPPIPKA